MSESVKTGEMSAEGKARLMRYAVYAAVLTSVLLIVVKFFTWLLTGSVSILSSLMDSVLDSLASLVNMMAVHHALQPADSEHRFGHGKAEPMAGLAQAALIAGSALFLFYEAGDHLIHVRAITEGTLGMAVMAFSIVATLALVTFQRYVVKITGSVAINADSLHYKGDVILNGSVIVALFMSVNLGIEVADPLLAGAVGVYILVNAVKIGRSSFDHLMDREFPDEDRARIRDIATAHANVRDMHDLRTRTSGLHSFIQLHLEMDGEITLARAHEISEEVMAGIKEAFPNAEILIHEDPEGIEEERAEFSD